MKTILISLTLWITTLAQAQPYFFLQDSASYTPLTNSTSINNGTVWSGFQTFSIPIGFTFDFMDASFTSVDLEATGRLIFDVNHYYFADMLVAQGLQDKGSGMSLSPLSYELTGTSPNQILKIEVNNAEYNGDPGSTVNFQIWLFEYTSRLELHMGAVTINDPVAAFGNGPMSGVYHVTNWGPTIYGYGLMAYNDPLFPDDTTFSGSGVSLNGLTLSNAPNETQIYIYSNDTSFLSVEVNNLDKIKFYPNPADLFIYFTELPVNGSIIVQSLSGQIILNKMILESNMQLDIDVLTAGFYIVSVRDISNHVILQEKLIIQ